MREAKEDSGQARFFYLTTMSLEPSSLLNNRICMWDWAARSLAGGCCAHLLEPQWTDYLDVAQLHENIKNFVAKNNVQMLGEKFVEFCNMKPRGGEDFFAFSTRLLQISD